MWILNYKQTSSSLQSLSSTRFWIFPLLPCCPTVQSCRSQGAGGTSPRVLTNQSTLFKLGRQNMPTTLLHYSPPLRIFRLSYGPTLLLLCSLHTQTSTHSQGKCVSNSQSSGSNKMKTKPNCISLWFF